MSLATFAVDRFSRIYPLYITTFLAVLIVQWLVRADTGSYLVYPYYDAYHALLNIFIVSAWGFEDGWSFNGPAWSISVEILLYITFAFGCMLGKARHIYFLALLILGYLLPASAFKVASGLTQFYLAGLLFVTFRKGSRRFGDRAIVPLAIAAIICWAVLIFAPDTKKFLLDTIAFPIGIVALAAFNLRYRPRIRLFEWLGDVSYSVYLWHFPLQCLFVLALFRLGYDKSAFYSPVIAVAFLALRQSFLYYRFRILSFQLNEFFDHYYGMVDLCIQKPSHSIKTDDIDRDSSCRVLFGPSQSSAQRRPQYPARS